MMELDIICGGWSVCLRPAPPSETFSVTPVGNLVWYYWHPERRRGESTAPVRIDHSRSILNLERKCGQYRLTPRDAECSGRHFQRDVINRMLCGKISSVRPVPG